MNAPESDPSRLRPTAEVGRERIDALDGIRAVAVVAVVVYHLFPTALPGGFLGVDVFFVLSGYLIPRGLMQGITSGAGIRLVRFWVRRATPSPRTRSTTSPRAPRRVTGTRWKRSSPRSVRERSACVAASCRTWPTRRTRARRR